MFARIHPHIKRAVLLEGEASRRRVDLHRGHPEVEQNRVDAGNLRTEKCFVHSSEVAAHQFCLLYTSKRARAHDALGIHAGALSGVGYVQGLSLLHIYCAQPLLRHIGAEAVCRASVAAYTTLHDIDRFLEAVESSRNEAVALATSRML